MGNKIGVILMTYGSATTTEHVREYIEHIYHGNASEALIRDFEERYRLVGHSPLVEITEKQAELLEKRLNDHDIDYDDDTDHDAYVVRAGMLHSKPFIKNAIRDCKDAGAVRLIGIILSPQFSSFIMEGYRMAFVRTAARIGFSEDNVVVAGPWPTEPHFIALLADRVRTAIGILNNQYQANIPIIFTTHSLPKRVVDKDPSYLEQLSATTDAILKNLNDPFLAWKSAYQSAGHTPEEWLKPDLTDALSDMRHGTRDKGARAVLIVPIQFLADHLEILYDLDTAAKKQCGDFGIAYHRIELPNAHPLFIEALASIVEHLA